MSKITEKIAKLLALAESPYEEEAKAALLQARRLMAEHMPPWAMRMDRSSICAAGWSLRRNSLLLPSPIKGLRMRDNYGTVAS